MMKKKICFILAMLLGATLMLSACNEWERYSQVYHEGTFAIRNYTESNFFTAGSEIEIAFVEPKDDTDGFVTQCTRLGDEAGHEFLGTAYFIFRNLAAEVEDIAYNHSKERSDTYEVKQDGQWQLFFTLYSYDWSDRIYVMGTDLYFERVEKTPETPDAPALTIDQEIKAAYLKAFPGYIPEQDHLAVEHIVEFDNTYIVRITGSENYNRSTDTLLIDGIFFDPEMDYFAYCDGEIYSIREAAPRGFELLTHDNLLTIQQERREKEAEIYAEHDKITQEIISAYVATRSDITTDDVSVEFYGIFSNNLTNTYVTMISVRGESFGAVSTSLTVGGVTFPNGQQLAVCRDGEFYTLQEAFDNSFLSKGDLWIVFENWTGEYIITID